MVSKIPDDELNVVEAMMLGSAKLISDNLDSAAKASMNLCIAELDALLYDGDFPSKKDMLYAVYFLYSTGLYKHTDMAVGRKEVLPTEVRYFMVDKDGNDMFMIQCDTEDGVARMMVLAEIDEADIFGEAQ